MDFKQQIESLIEERRKVYSISSNDLISSYIRDGKIAKDYQKREILEMIQNADDAGADELLIHLDKTNSTIHIANTGNESFTIKGVRSLMLSDLSGKTKKKYIGNKGLGFRSLLNWAENITLISNGVILKFSPQIAKKEFESLYDSKKRSEILKEREWNNNIVPVSLLSIPEVENIDEETIYRTKISLKFKKNTLSSIEEQIREIDERVLLFLNNIKKIVIKHNSENPIEIQSDKKWKLYSIDEKRLPKQYKDENINEPEYYSIKLAIEEHFSQKNGKLFTFLPTNISFEFPFILHGTFELDSSRKHLNEDSAKNEFIFTEAANLIVESSIKHFKNEVNWKIFQFLSYKNKNEELDKFNFYKSIDEKKEKLEIYPCIDGKYRKKKDTIFYNNDFAQFLIDFSFTKFFPNHLLPIPDDIKLDTAEIESYNKEIFISKIDDLSLKMKDIQQRAKLIFILADNSIFHFDNQKFSLIINNRNKLIDKENTTYTPKTKGEDIKIPDFVKLDFINKNLFDELVNIFGIKNSDKKSRELASRIESILNIQSYEPVPVLQKIIAGTNAEIKKRPEKKSDFIRDMIQSLFFIRKNNLDEKTKVPDSSKIQIINKLGSLIEAKNTFLCKDYPSGVLTEELFTGIYKKNQFIANRKNFGLQKEDEQTVEDFFLWLGVNKHTRFEKLNNPTDYENFVFSQVEKPFEYRESEIEVTAIANFDYIVSKLPKEKLIIWLIKDSFLKKQLDNSINEDSFYWKKKSEWYFNHKISVLPSYILFQFYSKNIFQDYIIGSYNIPFLNPFEINFNSPLFKKYEIEKRDIENVLIKIGAIESFNKLSIERVFEILKNLFERDEKGNFTQRVYKLAIEHYKKNNKTLPKEEFKLFSKKGNKGYYEINSKVFYSENLTLPKKIIENKPILNLPKRQGERQISAFFDVKTFNELNPKIKPPIEVNEVLTAKFNSYFQQIKPFLLSYRLSKLDKEKQENKEKEARLIKNVSIKIYYRCGYEIEGQSDELDYNDFINDNIEFHIKTKNYSEVSQLKDDFAFCDAFAEIMCIAFDVNEHSNDFSNIFKNEIKYTEHSILNHIGEEILEESRKLLGMSDYEKRFWLLIFNLKKMKLKDFRDNDELIKIAKDKLKINISSYLKNINYKDLSDKSNYPHLKELFELLKIDINRFNNSSELKIDFTEYHQEKLQEDIINYEKIFKNLLWHRLNTEKLKQDTFLDQIYSYKGYPFYVEEKLKNYRASFDCLYSEITHNYVSEKFSLQTDSEHPLVDYDSIMRKNLKLLDCTFDDLNNKTRSLLCFEGNIEKVRKFIDKEKSVEKENSSEENDIEFNIVISTLIKPTETDNSPNNKIKNKGSRGGSYNPNRDKKNREKGALAEKKTYEKLVELYGENNVNWRSENSEKPDSDSTLGYDIQYRKDENSKWKFLEVKSLSSDYFYLSRTEKEFGENNKENYELALVKDGSIHFIKDFFIFNAGELFENNSKYKVEENDYIINVDIKAKEKTEGQTQIHLQVQT